MKYNKQYIGIITSVTICVLLVFAGVYATTTVGNDVTIGGTLTVGGTSSSSFAGPLNILGDFHVGNTLNDPVWVGGGLYNDISASNLIGNYDPLVFVGNDITGGATYSSIMGGGANSIGGNSGSAFIGGGTWNIITAECDNYVEYDGVLYCGNDTIGREAIVGGSSNEIDIMYHDTYDGNSFIGGGYDNTIKASFGTIPGGYGNVVSGSYGFAAGRRAKVLASGSFALTDATDADFTINTTNVFGARFSNGYYLTGGAVSVSSSGIRLDEGITITSGTASASGNCGTAGSLYIRSGQSSVDNVISVCGSDAAWNPADL